jgi:hypothetical protein
MSRSQTVSTISSTEYIIQSLNLSFVHYNLTYVQRWTLSTLVLPLHFEGQTRGEVLPQLRPTFHSSNYTSRTKKVVGHEHIDDRTGLMCATILVPG